MATSPVLSPLPPTVVAKLSGLCDGLLGGAVSGTEAIRQLNGLVYRQVQAELPLSPAGPPPPWQNLLSSGFPLPCEKVASKSKAQCSSAVRGPDLGCGMRILAPLFLAGWQLNLAVFVFSLVKWEFDNIYPAAPNIDQMR